MRIIYCSDPLNPHQVDMDYQIEAEAATQVGLDYSLINFESLVNSDDPKQAIRRVSEADPETIGIYRGWMLKPEHYTRLYQALLQRGIRLINDPIAYQHTHYLPDSYSVIEGYTPRSVWLPIENNNVDFDHIMQILSPFGTAPIVIKDYVKSQKHYWNEAFYIPSASDRQEVERVVTRFLELQGDDLNEGLVFREFVTLEQIGGQAPHQLPIVNEYRLFFLNNKLLYFVEYWPNVNYETDKLPIDHFQAIAQTIKSQFFTMDIARRTDRQWIIVELGDGQVAGLPERASAVDFYTAINSAVSANMNTPK